MTEPYFYEDAYAQTISAVVTQVRDTSVSFDRTIFYPLGGGQPGDQGSLHVNGQDITISDTRRDSETREILHFFDVPSEQQLRLEPGAQVQLTLDWPRRFRHMQMHTAMHLLGSLIDAPVTGGQVGSEKSRLDFDAGDLVFDKAELTIQINALREQALPLLFETVSETLLDAQPELVRTMSVAPPRGVGDIRMVRIPDIDYQPCGGTHVRSLQEINPLIISKIENKGRQNRRVHLVFDETT
ncbi:MAG: alanyl-tRNA editing protein [Candidatus Azotimanducaceae bacterium]